MPYDKDKPADVKSMKDKLQKTYKGLSDKAVRQAIAVWNSVMDSSGDEGRAWASVYSKMNARGLSKKGSAPTPPSSMVRTIAKIMTEYLEDLPLDARQKTDFFYDFAQDFSSPGEPTIRRKRVDEALWHYGEDYIYSVEDEEEQTELFYELMGAVNAQLLRQGVIGRRAKRAHDKTAGFFSWECLGCGKSLLSDYAVNRGDDFGWMTQVVAVFKDGSIVKGEYDGYGRIDGRGRETEIVDAMWGKDGPSLWHEACWKAKGRPKWKGPSPSARDQGYFFDEEDYQGAVPGKKGRPPQHSILRSARLASEIERIAAKHPDHADALRNIAKEAAAWVPGELRDDSNWESGHVDPAPATHHEVGSQVPPARDSYGRQLDEEGNPEDSIPRAKAKKSSLTESWATLDAQLIDWPR